MQAENPFFDHPVLNNPYEQPARHWELDPSGQPTQRVVQNRRRAEFITPIPKPKKRKGEGTQEDIVFDEGAGLSTPGQRYATIPFINELRADVDAWRGLPNPDDWLVKPETKPVASFKAIRRSSGLASWLTSAKCSRYFLP